MSQTGELGECIVCSTLSRNLLHKKLITVDLQVEGFNSKTYIYLFLTQGVALKIDLSLVVEFYPAPYETFQSNVF